METGISITRIRFDPIATATKQIVIEHIDVMQAAGVEPTLVLTADRDGYAQGFGISMIVGLVNLQKPAALIQASRSQLHRDYH
jgi:hypothetical protein